MAVSNCASVKPVKLKGKRSMQVRSIRINHLLSQAYLVLISTSSLLLFMALAGTPLVESLMVSSVIGMQILVGIILFSETSTFEGNDFPLVLGAGITIGTSATLVFHQVFRSSPISSIAWLIPTIVAVLILILRFRGNTTKLGKEMSVPPIRYVFIGCILTAIGLADQWWWLYPIIFLFSAISFCFFLVNARKQRQLGKTLSVTFLILVLIFPLALFFTISLRKINSLWWILSYDIPYLESIAYSVNRWGSKENVSAVGTEISYHWFALAWAGMTTETSSAQSWTLLTIALPITVCMGIACLVYSICHFLTESPFVSLLTTAAVLVVRDVVSVTSPSLLYAFLPFLLVVRISLGASRSKRITRSNVILLLFLIFCLFGSKVSSGATLVSAIGLTLLFSRELVLKAKIAILILISLTTVLSYQYFFGNSVRPASLKIRVSDIGGRLIVGRPLGAGNLRYLLEVITQLLYFIPVCSGILLLCFKQVRTRVLPDLQILIWISISGFLLSRFLDGEGTESYFMHSTFATGLIVLVVFTLQIAKDNQLFTNRYVFALTISLGIAIGCVRSLITRVVVSGDDYSVIGRTLPHVAAFLIIIFISIGFVVLSRSSSKRLLFFGSTLCLLLGAMFIGEQLEKRARFSSSTYLLESTSDAEFAAWNHFAGSPDQKDSLNWIARNVPKDEIIATNRRCLSTTFCGPPKWMLVSALAKHQILIEGNKTGFPDSTPWLDERIILSERFIASPNQKDLLRLLQLGVTYHYVELGYVNKDYQGTLGFRDIAELNNMSWMPYAEVVHRNSTTLVLRLLKSTES
jgi:hypothetical protein